MLQLNIERLFPQFEVKYGGNQRVRNTEPGAKYPAVDLTSDILRSLVRQYSLPNGEPRSGYAIYYMPNKIFLTENQRAGGLDRYGTYTRTEFDVHSHNQGNAVVISTGHMDKDTNLNDRLIKVTLHEVGHLMGAVHCNNKRCIMNLPMKISPEQSYHLDENTAFYICDPCGRRINEKNAEVEDMW